MSRARRHRVRLLKATASGDGQVERAAENAPARVRANVHGRGRELLLVAALDLFSKRGYARTSTKDVAERAGVTEPMLFRHFGSKANLFQEATVTPFVDFMDRYIAEYRTREHGRLSAAEEGQRFFQGLYRALRDQREPLLALMSAGRFGHVADEVDEQVRRAFRRVIDLFEEVVASEAAQRGFTDPDLPASVRVMFGMALSAALHEEWMALPGRGDDPERMLAAMTRISVRGLGADRPR